MLDTINLPLQITLIGMGLVFAAILLLGLVMSLIVRLARDEDEGDEELIIVSAGKRQVEAGSPKAAAAAIAVALALGADAARPHPFPLPPSAFVSAWQAVLRTRMLTKRGMRR